MTWTTPSPSDSSSGFKFFRQLNTVEDLSWVASKTFITPGLAERFFQSDRLGDKLVRILALEKVLPVKEILESCEFFERIRKDLRSESVIDLCCGHGLVGLLFAIFERGTKQVVLIDSIESPSHRLLLKQVALIAPWIQDKVQFRKGTIDSFEPSAAAPSSIVSSHACGLLTDQCLETAIAIKGNVAVMPCCYPKSKGQASKALQFALGHELALDIDRTYRLEQSNYSVRWTSIPNPITPMNRVLVGRSQS